jgi:hypothetical protein
LIALKKITTTVEGPPLTQPIGEGVQAGVNAARFISEFSRECVYNMILAVF